MLVDGSLIENVPLTTMQQLKSGPNVVVHFGLPAFERFAVDYDSIPGRWRLMLQPPQSFPSQTAAAWTGADRGFAPQSVHQYAQYFTSGWPLRSRDSASCFSWSKFHRLKSSS